MAKKRCAWVSDAQIYKDYHDHVWGRPVTDSKQLYAKLCLDGQQAGLCWITILKKQNNYENLFHQFDPEKVATMTQEDIERRMQEPGIIRNRQKISAIIDNARAYQRIEKEEGSFSDFIWQFVDHRTIVNSYRDFTEVPTSSPASHDMAKALKQRGFKFVGSTICYAFMQAVGMVNDHTLDCHCYDEVRSLARR